MKKNFLRLFVPVFSGLLLCGCTASDGVSSEALSTPNEIYINAEAQTEEERIARLDLGGSVLPVLPDVTTAEDNSVLAPSLLRKGDQNPVVMQLQERLMSLGYMDNDEPTDFYGDATSVAVMHFQRQNGLTQDGICGTETWDKIFSSSAPYYKVSKGDDGDDIARIQQRLYELGYLAEASSVTGHFGDETEQAVIKLQSVNGLSQDGAVGKETVNLLYSDEVKANFVSFGEESPIVMKAQQRLKELGYYTGEADGKFGNDTMEALRNFQSFNDQVVDGYLGPSTRQALESPDAVPFALRVGDENSAVTSIQQKLASLGYLNSSNVTGYYGSITEAAVKDFQRVNGLSQDGAVGAQTMAKLESGDAKKKPAGSSSSRPSGGSSSSGGGSSRPSGGSGSGGSSSVGSGGATVSGSAQALVNEAAKHLGKPYVWGAKGPNSFDCSGFVYYCLRQVGVNQSYITSSGWRNPGRYQRISNFNDIQAGDIVVVSGHVGIAAGGGTVIDASSSNGRVVHRSLSSWWRNNFIVAWRIFG